MKHKTFYGGVHPEYAKELTSGQAIQTLPAPKVAVVPLSQHIGAPADPLVGKGDQVLVGQVIGQRDYPVTAAVHSPVSGTVKAVEERPSIGGRPVLSVVIENDGEDKWVDLSPHPDPIQLSREEIKDRIKRAGIVGLGGAAFPTSVKISPPEDAVIEYLLINGSECEPYLTADYRLMVEAAAGIILGSKLLAKACGAPKIVIAVEDNKLDAASALREAAGSGAIEVVVLDTKYPQGGEKQLIKALFGREVPRNGLPFQVGVIVQNVGTAFAVYQAIKEDRPLIERVVTVTGAGVKEPGNFRVRIGTPISELVEAAGGFSGKPGKVISGGPMMGLAQSDLAAPVVKGTSGILVLREEDALQFQSMPCIKCARCVDVCPVYLMPVRIETLAMREMWDEAADYGAMDCIECGCCTYICPSKRYLLHWIRLAKNEITAKRRKNG